MKCTASAPRFPFLLTLTAAVAGLPARAAHAQPAPAEPDAADTAPEEPAPAAEPGSESEPAAPAPPPPEPVAATAPPASEPPVKQTPAAEAATSPAPLQAAAPPQPPVEQTPPPPPATPLPITIGGSFWSRYELRSGYVDHGLSHPRLHREGDYIVSRARLVVKTTPAELGNGMTASATFVPQAAYTMGETGAPATIGDDPGVALYEGYASVGGQRARFDAGRFMMNYGDALVIGNLGWNESARSFNGARFHWTPTETPLYVDFFATLISEGRTVTQDAIMGDVYFWGAYAGLGPALAEGLDLDVYLLGQSTARNEDVTLTDPDDATNTSVGELEPTTDLTLGSRLKGKVSLLDYRVEAGLQFGKSPVSPTFADPDPEAVDHFAYQADAELGVSPAAGLRLALEGLYASGNDPTTPDKNEGYNELYPTAHKFLGFADIVGGRTNIASAVLHLKYAPVEPLSLMVDAHYFSRPQADASGEDGTMGSEIDTNVLYAFGAGASVRAMYALFLPNKGFWEPKATSADTAGDSLHYFELQFGYELK